MTKEVIISIKGLQYQTEDKPIEVITPGLYYNKNDKHYIRYEEVSEQDDITKCTIKAYDGYVEVMKKGAANSDMIFQLKKTNITYYNTPFGNLLIGINANKMNIDETEDEINIAINYSLEINYEHVSDCDITINVKSKHIKEYHII